MVKPELDIFSSPKDLGTIYREQMNINVKFIELNIPFTDTAGRISYNLGGKSRIIVVQGVHTGENFDGATQEQKLADFIFEMEEWVNANVQGKQIYTDSFGVSYNVDAVDWEWTRINNDPNRIVYSLIMRERI